MTTQIDAVLERLAVHPLVTVHRGASEEHIKEFFGFTKVKLPKSYLAFLRRIGWASLNGDILYGLGPDVADAESVLENCIVESVDADPPMRSFLVPLMNDGAGNHDCLDTSKMKDGECPVVFWDHEHAKGEFQRPTRVAKNFTEWLARKIDDLPEP